MHTGVPAVAPPTVRKWLRALLVSRRLPLLVGLIAALLALPSLGVGWVADDWWHRVVLKGSPALADFGILPSGSIMELFRFLDGDPRRAARLMDLGILPWWTDPHIHGAFMRPITGLTHWLDYRLWPDRAWLMHLHSVLWLTALAAAVALLYRRVMGVTAAAGLAAVLYAIDDARAMPVGFLANRNALIAGVFGVLALLAHDRWRREGWRTGAVAAPLLLALSMLSSEAGVGILAYLAAYALCLDHAPWRVKWLTLTPHAAVIIAWRVVWRMLGYGVSTSMEFYVDPLAEPVRFLGAVMERAPILLWGQWLMGSDPIFFLPRMWFWGFWFVALLFLLWLGLRGVPGLRRDPTARFWAAGMLLALPPACATIPNDRMLLYVGLGAFGLLGAFLTGTPGGAATQRAAGFTPALLPDGMDKIREARRSGRILRGLLIAMHLVVAPLVLAVRAANPAGPRGVMARMQSVVPNDAPVEGRDLIIVNPAFAMALGFVPILRTEAGLPMPRHIRTLGPSLQNMEITRPDERTLIIRPQGGYLLNPFDQIFRGSRTPLALGERIELTGLTVEVTALTPDRRPAEVVFRFDRPLEDASLLWVQWKDWAYMPFTPPRVGATEKL